MREHYIEQVKQALNERKHVSYSLLEYIKYYRKWKKTNTEKSSPLEKEIPWINFAALKFLKSIIRPEMVIFEFGAGGSSLFFSKFAKKVISVEHDKSWFELVDNTLKQKQIHNWEGHNILPEENDTEDVLPKREPANPTTYCSGDTNFSTHTFKQYASFIDHFEDNSFDLVLIDGRARPSCLKHSLSKVKLNGYIILDNSQVPYYLNSFDKQTLNGEYKIVFDKYGAGPFSSWFWETTIWKKIK